MVQELGVPIGVSLTAEAYSYLTKKILSTEAYPPQGRALIWLHPFTEEFVFSSARYKSDDFRHCARIDFSEVDTKYVVAACVYAEPRHHSQIISEIKATILSIIRKYDDSVQRLRDGDDQ